MEITDLVMLLILEKIESLEWQDVKVIYGYDTKRISLNPNDYIEVYSRGQNMDWLGIGGTNYRITENVSVVVRSKTKDTYMKIREMIKSLFTGGVFEFTADGGGSVLALEMGDDFDEISFWGTYVIKVHLIQDPEVYGFSRGDYVELHFDGETLNGWVYGVIGDDLFIFTRRSIACLIRPVRINEESMSLRKIFRATFDIEGTLIEKVEV